MARLLTDDEYDVAPFTKGEAATDALSQESFDVVVTDLEMPHLDRHAVVHTARRFAPTACVVVVSARAREARQTLVRAGARTMHEKPIDFDALTAAVADCRARGGHEADGGCQLRSMLERSGRQ